MTDQQKSELVDALIKEDDNSTVADYISVLKEVECVESSILVQEFSNQIIIPVLPEKKVKKEVRHRESKFFNWSDYKAGI